MISFAVLLLQDAHARFRRLRHDDEAGASVLEWAMIAAVVVVAASIIGAVIFNIVNDKSSQLDDCANQPAGSACG
jgi:Flp pilus assembly pilin Flp